MGVCNNFNSSLDVTGAGFDIISKMMLNVCRKKYSAAIFFRLLAFFCIMCYNYSLSH